MEQYVGIAIIASICLLCLIQIALFSVSIYKKRLISSIIHFAGIIVSLVICTLLILYIQGKQLPIKTNTGFLIIIICMILAFILISIETLFVDSDDIDYRIKQKKEKLKQLQKVSDNVACDIEETNKSDSKAEGTDLKNVHSNENKDNSNSSQNSEIHMKKRSKKNHKRKKK